MAAEKGSSPARLTSTYRTDQPYRVHISYVWLRPVLSTIAVVAAIVASNLAQLIEWAREAAQYASAVPWQAAILGGLGVLVVAYLLFAGLNLLAYRNLSYSFGESDFNLRSGVLSKQRVHLPYARVQSVNHRASLLQRLLGVCDATVESAGGSTNTAIKIPYLTLSDVERLRAELFARRDQQLVPGCELVYDASLDVPAKLRRGRASGDGSAAGTGAPSHPGSLAPERPSAPAADEPLQRPSATEVLAGTGANRLAGAVGSWRGALGGSAQKEEAATFETGLTNAELILASIALSSFLPSLMAAIFAVLALLPALSGMPGVEAAPGLAVSLGGIVAATAFSVVRSAVQVGGFTVRRRGARIEAEWGMVNHRYSGLEVDRVQSLVIRRGMVHRLLHRCEVRVEKIAAAGGGPETMNGQLLHPFLPMDQLEGFLSRLLPEFQGRPRRDELVPLERPRVMRRALVRRVVLRLPLVLAAVGVAISLGALATLNPDREGFHIQVGWVSIALPAGVVGLCAIVAGTLLWVRESGYALNRDYAAITNGGLAVKTVILPRAKAQSFFMRSNPFQRRLRLATIGWSYAALTSRTCKLRDVDEEQARAWVDWLRPSRHAEGPAESGEESAGRADCVPGHADCFPEAQERP